MEVNQNYKDLLRVFDQHQVRFLVAGGFAVMLYTEPYATKDLDVWVEPVDENAVRVFKALAEFGAPLANATVDDFVNPAHIYQIGAGYVRIDVLMNVAGLTFDEAWKRRNTVDFEGRPVPFLSREDLITAKRAAGRPRDLLQLKRLLRTSSKPPKPR